MKIKKFSYVAYYKIKQTGERIVPHKSKGSVNATSESAATANVEQHIADHLKQLGLILYGRPLVICTMVNPAPKSVFLSDLREWLVLGAVECCFAGLIYWITR